MSSERVQPLLARFTHVFIGDSTSIALTGEFPGSSGRRAAAKWQVIWDFL